MEIGWLAGAGAALVGGSLCYWVWRARRAGAAQDSLRGYLVGDQVGGGVGPPYHGHHHHHDAGGSGDSGGGDGSADA
jgi:hypothetical protein